MVIRLYLKPSFSSINSGLCIYYLFIWLKFSSLHNSQWITFSIQSCILLSISEPVCCIRFFFFYVADCFISFSSLLTLGIILSLIYSSFYKISCYGVIWDCVVRAVIIILLFANFYISFNCFFFTEVWVTVILIGSPGLSWVIWFVWFDLVLWHINHYR